MFHTMRRSGQKLSPQEIIAIFERNTAGVLALMGENGYPYALPMSYVYIDNGIYFHSATEGHKLDCIAHNNQASFCVIDQDEVKPEEFNTYYRSAIAFGKMRVVQDEQEKRAAITLLSEKYSPGHPGRENEINQTWDRLCMLFFDIEHMTGKASRDLIAAEKAAQ